MNRIESRIDNVKNIIRLYEWMIKNKINEDEHKMLIVYHQQELKKLESLKESC